MENLWHKIIMNHKIGIILRLIMTNDISIIGISVVTYVKYFLILQFKVSFNKECCSWLLLIK